MRVLIDTNLWSEVANQRAGDELAYAARAGKKQLLVAPTVIEELRGRPLPEARKASLQVATRCEWKRLMPDAYNESQELKAEILRLRPQWVRQSPSLKEVHRLRYDWVKRKGGYWDRARQDISEPDTNESLRGESELRLAREQSRSIRQRVHKSGAQGGNTPLQDVAYIPTEGTRGWTGKPVEYWRMPSLAIARAELQIYASPYREWLDSEVDVLTMLYEEASMNRLWLHELDPSRVPRQWLRGAFEFLQAWSKVTDGNPADSAFAGYLVDADFVLSADQNFVRFAKRCHSEAPFLTARAQVTSSGATGVQDLIAFLRHE